MFHNLKYGIEMAGKENRPQSVLNLRKVLTAASQHQNDKPMVESSEVLFGSTAKELRGSWQFIFKPPYFFYSIES